MPILYECGCGARYRAPDSAAGRRARCKKCGAVFTLQSTPAAESPPPIPKAKTPAPQSPPPAPDSDDGLIPFNDDDPFAHAPSMAEFEASAPAAADAPPPPAIAAAGRGQAPAQADSTVDAVYEPPAGRSFWVDLVASLVFFVDPGNFVTVLIVAFINVWMFLLKFAGCVGLIGQAILSGYLAALYFNIVSETASGEDELPGVTITDFATDILSPLFRFTATWIIALLPVIVLLLGTWFGGWPADYTMPAAMALAALGCFLWPVIVLAVSLGGGLAGLNPVTLIRTVIAAPIGYIAIWVLLLIAAGVLVASQVVLALGFAAAFTSNYVWLIVGVLCASLLDAYAPIVAMRAIGLYYRHFKHKFPWAME
jgi:hypothetical protein